jgi:hypothetical protein
LPPRWPAAFGLLGVVGERAALAQQLAQCQLTEIHGAEGGILYGSFGEQTLQLRDCAPGDILIAQGPIPTLLLEPPNPVNPDSEFSRVFDVRPCSLAGCSDLQGVKLTVTFQSRTRAANASTVMTLAPDKCHSKCKIHTTPTRPGAGLVANWVPAIAVSGEHSPSRCVRESSVLPRVAYAGGKVNIRCWHFADMLAHSPNVRYWG